MATMTTVGELMTDYPVVTGIDSRLADAAEAMQLYHVTGLPVCDRSGHLVGVLSQTDMVRVMAAGPLLASWDRLTVRHVMTCPAITVESGTPLLEAGRLMRRTQVHRLIVLGADGETPIGVLSMSDLVCWVIDLSEPGPSVWDPPQRLAVS